MRMSPTGDQSVIGGVKSASGRVRFGRQMFDQGHLSSGMQLTKVYLIHEGTDEKDAASCAAEEILRCERIRDGVWVEPGSLIGDGNDEGFAIVLESSDDFFCGVVVVAVEDGIDCSFANGHGETEAVVLAHAGVSGELVCSCFDLGYAVHGGTERELQFTCSRLIQWRCLLLSLDRRCTLCLVRNLAGSFMA